MKKSVLLSTFFTLLLFINCKSIAPASPTGLVTEKAMVVSARKEASTIGVEIMKKGGNAFDAMVLWKCHL